MAYEQPIWRWLVHEVASLGLVAAGVLFFVLTADLPGRLYLTGAAILILVFLAVRSVRKERPISVEARILGSQEGIRSGFLWGLGSTLVGVASLVGLIPLGAWFGVFWLALGAFNLFSGSLSRDYWRRYKAVTSLLQPGEVLRGTAIGLVAGEAPVRKRADVLVVTDRRLFVCGRRAAPEQIPLGELEQFEMEANGRSRLAVRGPSLDLVLEIDRTEIDRLIEAVSARTAA